MLCVLVHTLARRCVDRRCATSAPPQWHPIFASVLESVCNDRSEPLGQLIRDDLVAVNARDPACQHVLHALLFFKGFLGIQARAAWPAACHMS